MNFSWLLLWFFGATISAVSNTDNRKYCPCSGTCYDSGSSTYDDNVYDTQTFNCLSGYKCKLYSSGFYPYKEIAIKCRSVCESVFCSDNQTCQIVRAQYGTQGKFTNVPTCETNPCDTARCMGFDSRCQLKVKSKSCQKYGQSCKVQAYCVSPCSGPTPKCPNGTYCSTLEDSTCPVKPCPVGYTCLNDPS